MLSDGKAFQALAEPVRQQTEAVLRRLTAGRREQQAVAPQVGGIDLAAHESRGLKPFQIGDLHALLAAAHLPGPYVLVGHSLGGLFARLHAQTYPEQVRAVVFVDAFPIEIPSLMGSDWPTYRQQLDGPPPQFTNSPSFELIDIGRSVAPVAAAPVFPPIPTIVLARTEPFSIPSTVPAEKGANLEQAWQEATSDLVALRPQTPRIFATGSDHFVQIHQPDLVVAGVDLAIQRSASKR